ncbi:hypothetical protein PHSC3_000846 [Chlamydiales bacterium STE3]|nr:hypothetical protein PHSC3_000846 [Chlamydiales bacterium STE3]
MKILFVFGILAVLILLRLWQNKKRGRASITECSYFQPLLGKAILDILFDNNTSSFAFGHLLRPETIEENFLIIRNERDLWAEANPAKVAEIRKEIKEETHLVTK